MTTKPLTPATCARKLGVGHTYILQAIHLGRLEADCTVYPETGRKRYTITHEAWRRYLVGFWPHKLTTAA